MAFCVVINSLIYVYNGYAFKGLESSKRKDLYYSRKVYENFRVFGYIDADLFEKNIYFI